MNSSLPANTKSLCKCSKSVAKSRPDYLSGNSSNIAILTYISGNSLSLFINKICLIVSIQKYASKVCQFKVIEIFMFPFLWVGSTLRSTNFICTTSFLLNSILNFFFCLSSYYKNSYKMYWFWTKIWLWMNCRHSK